MGYVKAINNYNSGIGLTFENLLGKKVDDFPLPDFQNEIEIKTKLAFSTKPIHLFKLTPDGTEFFEMKRIVSKYGYYKMMSKVLSGSVFANKKTKIGRYYFSLFVNYKAEKVVLQIYNRNKVLIDNTSYWAFEKIETAMKRKLEYLAIVLVWPTQKNGTKYYKYYRYDIYKYTNIYTLLNLIDKGIISISFSISTYSDEERYGKAHDHGTSFDIYMNDVKELFDRIT